MLLSFLTFSSLFFFSRAHDSARPLVRLALGYSDPVVSPILPLVVRNVQLVGLTTCAPQGNTTNASSIQWGPCDPSLVANPSLSCGFFEIPLDYHDSSAGKGRLAVIKANATGERRGTFFVNPGW